MHVVILFLIAASAVVTGNNDCVQRIVGPLNEIVCVCNSTYCDSAPDIQVKNNEYVIYISTESGKRLQPSVNNFSNRNESMFYDITFTVNSHIEFQTIFGFGGAMTDAAALNIRTLSNATQNKIIETYYGAEGSKYTFCRIPIAGTDFSTRPYTYDDIPDDNELSHFALVEEDDYKIDYLHRIKNVMPDPQSLKIFTAAWSAPTWMKTSNDIKWGALKYEYYQLYANYICKFFDAYKSRDINIWGTTPGNEPLDGSMWFFPFNSMLWTPSAEAIFTTQYLYPTLSNAGYKDVVYMAMDDQRFMIPTYPKLVYKNPEAKKLFGGTAYHWYTDTFFSPERMDELHSEYPDKFILMTEACSGSNPFEMKVILGSWQRGEDYLSDIIENMLHWVVGWVDWNLALNTTGGPNWAKNFVDSPIIVIPENDEFYKQPMYYALSHISKFVPPNSKRIFLAGLEDNIKSVAFLTPEKDVVVVMMNKNKKSYNIAIQDTNMLNNLIHIQLPGKSFATLKYHATQ